ncbi:GTP cyclohydrolase I [Bradyrhizobium sp. 38]|nr:GTP cyclohydrolase I [Bradyrhizobium sp. 38]MCK1777964.1 GTP cyclohydrolase I [Bradyrhizobium sp. 132]
MSVIGISKVVRVANLIMALPQSKRKRIMLADELERHINPKGLAVMVMARHQCVWRGVRETETTMVTSIMRRVSATSRYCVANFWRSSRTKP